MVVDPLAHTFDQVMTVAFFGAGVVVLYTMVLRPWLGPRFSNPAIHAGLAIYFAAYLVLATSHLVMSYSRMESAIDFLAETSDTLQVERARQAKDALVALRRDALQVLIGVGFGMHLLLAYRREREILQEEGGRLTPRVLGEPIA